MFLNLVMKLHLNTVYTGYSRQTRERQALRPNKGKTKLRFKNIIEERTKKVTFPKRFPSTESLNDV